MAAKYVLDTSALLALRSDEAGADEVEGILRRASTRKSAVFVSFMTRMEIFYRLTVSEDEDSARAALRLIDATGVQWVSCEPEILEQAARLKAGGGLSVADAWIAATALVHDAVLVHKDAEFAGVRSLRQERLRG
jgi:predicted nucleic acid-binding protein